MSVVGKKTKTNNNKKRHETNRTMIVLMLQAGLAAPISRVGVGKGEGLQRLRSDPASRRRQRHSLVVVLQNDPDWKAAEL